MKFFSSLIFLLITTSTLIAQNEKGMQYINDHKNIAMSEMIRTGVPASITLAQGMLESAYGESDLSKKSNNHFGIKCKTEWTGEKTYHNDDIRNECFRVYPNVDSSYKDHSDFLRTRPYYTELFKLSPMDNEGWAYGLKKAGYATEQDYPQKLLKLINDYNLNQFNVLAIHMNDSINSFVNVIDTTSKKISNTITFSSEAENESEQIESSASLNIKQSDSLAKPIKKNFPSGVFSINHTKVIYAAKGCSLLSIANQYNITLSKLLAYNDMDDLDVLQNDGFIFLERKQKKGATDYRTLEINETLYNISQEEGVRMENILLYNNLKKSTVLNIGDKIYLRPVLPSLNNNKTSITVK